MWARCLAGAAVAALVACSAGVDPEETNTFGPPAMTQGNSNTSPTTGFDTTDDDDDGDSTSGEVGGESSSSGKVGSTGLATSTGGGPGVCGNGLAEGSESCDGEDLAGATCADFGFEGGLVVCDKSCSILTEACKTCGDGAAALTEACDGDNFLGETCQSQGFGGGALLCAADCSALDTSSCTPLASCGDGARNGGEQCDGADLGGSNCSTLGFDFGSLACSPGSCTYNTADCGYLTCGQQGDFCFPSDSDPQSNCCDAGVGGNIFGVCALLLCT